MIRIFYSGACAWIVLASTSENGVPVTAWLNHKIFVHLNKLSYGIYLLNPVVVAFVYGVKDHSDHFTPITLVSSINIVGTSEDIKSIFFFQFVMSIGISVIVYLLAFVCSLLFEVPYNKISSLLKNYKTKTL